MKALSIYISLLFFTVCLAAPSVAVLSNVNVKETKVAKLFDMEEEEDARDTDTETEKECDPTEKFFKSFFASAQGSQPAELTILVHHTHSQFQLQETTPEQLTPPPRC